MVQNKLILIFSALVSLVFATNSYAYLSVLESGEILSKEEHRLGVEPQILLNEGGGINIGTYLDMPLTDALSSRYHLGVGKIDFHAGASLKWIPFPDIDRQPAMGGRLSAWYARTANENVITVQIAPLFSKKVQLEWAQLAPFLAIPVNVVNGKERNYTGTQFVMGSEAVFNAQPNFTYAAEVAINLKDSYSYISGSIAFPFDEKSGIRRKKGP